MQLVTERLGRPTSRHLCLLLTYRSLATRAKLGVKAPLGFEHPESHPHVAARAISRGGASPPPVPGCRPRSSAAAGHIGRRVRGRMEGTPSLNPLVVLVWFHIAPTKNSIIDINIAKRTKEVKVDKNQLVTEAKASRIWVRADLVLSIYVQTPNRTNGNR